MAKRILSLILALVCLQIAACAQTEFSKDFKAINEAANSVLMLEITRYGQIIATGSGFVAFNNHTLVTNCHVIEDADSIRATSDDKYSFVLDKVIAVDEKADLAILGFASPTDRAPLALNAGEILRAEPVVAIGSPKGMLNVVSLGNVSALSEDDGVGYVQFTAPISSGSSGGALFNDRGEVIGVTTAAYDDDRGIVQNLNFAVNAVELVRLGAEMDEHEAVWLEDYRDGARPGQTPEPTATPTPAPTVAPDPGELPIESSEPDWPDEEGGQDLSGGNTDEQDYSDGGGDYTEPTPKPTPVNNYRKASPDQIEDLQWRLIDLRWLNDAWPSGRYDKATEKATEKAVKDFQQYVNETFSARLKVDGTATSGTIKWLMNEDAPIKPDTTPEPTPEPEETVNPADQAVQRLADLGWMAEGAIGQDQTDAIFAFQEAAIASGIFPDVMLNGTLDQPTIACLLSPDAPSAF